MAPGSPRKVPLSGGPLEHTRSEAVVGTSQMGRITSRAYFCAVVVEGGGDQDLPRDVQDMIVSLGSHVPPSNIQASTSSNPATHEKSRHDPETLADIINEFIVTERSYVKRLRTLKESYADPLRNFARKKESAILPPYEAKTLFGNINDIVPINEAFLADLEAAGTYRIGDICLKHFRDLRAFDCYKAYYSKREEAQAIFEREMSKRNGSSFADFIDHVKYSTDTDKRVGLRELLMEPIQRIPRYTLLWRTMTKNMLPSDPQRAKLIEADSIASQIALCETDEQTKRAAVMYCLHSSIDGFPPKLISNRRRFLDCVDVEDHESEEISHASLFLFDDILVIAKRHNTAVGGKALAGLDSLEKSGAALPGLMSSRNSKKGSMSFKGVVEITDVSATSVGPGCTGLHLYFSTIPTFESVTLDRWSKAFRSFQVVLPPRSPGLDPVATSDIRQRFIDTLWEAQARVREKHGRSLLLARAEGVMEDKKGVVEKARVFWNVYERRSYLGEPCKPKVVLHIDSLGTADAIPFGIDGAAPLVVIRVQPLAGDICRFNVKSTDPSDEGEEVVLETDLIPEKTVQTIHEYGLFKFRTGSRNSQPTTPTSLRSRAAIFGLDALSISRNLFGGRTGGLRDGLFSPGQSIGHGSHRRSKSSASRTSTTTVTTNTEFRFSQRSNSTATQATSIFDDSGNTLTKIPRKLLKSRARSPGPGAISGSESDASPIGRGSRTASHEPRALSREESFVDPDAIIVGIGDYSESDLNQRLALARRNSKNQPVESERRPTARRLPHPPVEPIYETDEPPSSILRPQSRVSQTSHQSKESGVSSRTSIHRSRSNSRHSPERRPAGPRAPSPMPPKSPSRPTTPALELENVAPVPAMPSMPARPHSPSKSRRLPFEPVNTILDETPKKTTTLEDITPRRPVSAVEPLSIKKKNSMNERSSPVRAPSVTDLISPVSEIKANGIVRSVASPRLSRGFGFKTPERPSKRKEPPVMVSIDVDISLMTDAERDIVDSFIALAERSKSNVSSSIRAVKRLKTEFDEENSPPVGRSSPTKGRTPTSRTPVGSEAPYTQHLIQTEVDSRMDEMRQLIALRNGGGGASTPVKRRFETPPVSPSKERQVIKEPLQKLVSAADSELQGALDANDSLQIELRKFARRWRERAGEIEKARADLLGAKRQCELLKSLLSDSTDENEILFEAFNEELDMMFSDAQLPEDEAWQAMVSDLRNTKEARNQLKKENAQLKRSLEQITLQRDEWEGKLRAHGLL